MSKFTVRNTMAKRLTAVKVLDIRTKYATGEWTMAALARLHSVTPNTISSVIHGTTWQDVPQVKSNEQVLDEAALLRQQAKESEERMKQLLAAAVEPTAGLLAGALPTAGDSREDAASRALMDRLTADIAQTRASAQSIDNELEELKNK